MSTTNNQFTFKKKENGAFDISLKDIADFNKAILDNKAPESAKIIEFNTQNFDTCQFRSENTMTKTMTCCNGKKTVTEGYLCRKLGLFNVQPPDCFQCPKYEKKS